MASRMRCWSGASASHQGAVRRTDGGLESDGVMMQQ